MRERRIVSRSTFGFGTLGVPVLHARGHMHISCGLPFGLPDGYIDVVVLTPSGKLFLSTKLRRIGFIAKQ
jgi:hypothetical protein